MNNEEIVSLSIGLQSAGASSPSKPGRLVYLIGKTTSRVQDKVKKTSSVDARVGKGGLPPLLFFFFSSFIFLLSSAAAQTGGSYDLSHSVIAGGGGSQSAGGAFTVAGTVGQNLAGTVSTGTDFSLRGGFWALQSFTPTAAPASISGRITTGDGFPVAGVVMILSGSTQARTITDSNGLYAFSMVEVGGFYTLVPSRANYTFTPTSQSFSLLADKTEAVFTATPDAMPATNPLDTPEFFVRQHYLDFLGREPDASGLSFWANQITACGADAACISDRRVNVSAAFFLSIEFQETSGNVIRTQRVAFGRQSNDAASRVPYLQFMRDTRQVGAGVIVGEPGFQTVLDQNKQAYAQQIVTSTEFLARFPITPAGPYVDALFASAGVIPTLAERQAAIDAFGAGDTAGRVAALRSVADSASVRQAEFRPSFVLAQYYGYLRRSPTGLPDVDDSGYQFWLAKLNSFNGDFRQAEMVKAFLLSSEYRSRFN